MAADVETVSVEGLHQFLDAYGNILLELDGVARRAKFGGTVDVSAAVKVGFPSGGGGGGAATQLDANGMTLDVNAIADGELLRRVGVTVVGYSLSGVVLADGSVPFTSFLAVGASPAQSGAVRLEANSFVSIFDGAMDMRLIGYDTSLSPRILLSDPSNPTPVHVAGGMYSPSLVAAQFVSGLPDTDLRHVGVGYSYIELDGAAATALATAPVTPRASFVDSYWDGAAAQFEEVDCEFLVPTPGSPRSILRWSFYDKDFGAPTILNLSRTLEFYPDADGDGSLGISGKAWGSLYLAGLDPLAPPAAPTVVEGAAVGGPDAGTHKYAYTKVTALGESTPGTRSAAFTAGGGHQADVTLPSLAAGVLSYNLYRTVADDDAGTLRFVTNTGAGTFSDDVADASLTFVAPTANTAYVLDDGQFAYDGAGPTFVAANVLRASGFTLPLGGVIDLGNGATLRLVPDSAEQTCTFDPGTVPVSRYELKMLDQGGNASQVVILSSFSGARVSITSTGRLTLSPGGNSAIRLGGGGGDDMVYIFAGSDSSEAVAFNSDGAGNVLIGFRGKTPVAAPDYTVTNGATDRSFDANSTSIDELADIVATLIADLTAIGLLA